MDFMLAACCAGFEAEAARDFLARLTNTAAATRYVLNAVERRAEMEAYLSDDPGEGGWMALFDASACAEDLILLTRAAHADGESDWPERERRLRGLCALYRERMDRPFAMGRDLVAAGVRPGPQMGRALEYAHGLRLAGVEKAEQLEQTLRWLERGEEGHD